MRWLPLGLWGLLAGCVHLPQMTSVELAGRARENVIAAQRDLAGKEVVVRGGVRQAAMSSRRNVVLGGGLYRPEAHEQRESLPLIVLEPGSVLCYFEPDRLDDAADIKQGDAVALECTIASFRNEGSQVLTILGDCRKNRRP